MKIIKKHIFSWLLVITLMISNVSFVFAAENDSLNLYRDKLEEINIVLGTNYKIPDKEEIKVTGMTYEELQQFYADMSLEEFEQYIYQLDAKNDHTKVIEVNASIENENIGILPAATASSQYFYYSSSNSNYLALFTNVVQSGGVTYYNSVTGYGKNKQATGYPYYSPYGFSYTPSSDSRQLSCSYKCSKYISAGVIDTGAYTLRVTFTAGGGNIYA